VRVLLVDNHDSYTWNLAHQVARITGRLPRVARNDVLTLDQADAFAPDALLLSPGPGRPGIPRDLGITEALLRHRADWPTLGVCLGHQALAWVHGAPVVRAPSPVHGRLHPLRHDGRGLFHGLPQGLQVVRYHSLCVGPLPDTLQACAWSPDGVVQAVREVAGPRCGVQFHPESIGTRHGTALVARFLEQAGLPHAAPPPPVPRRLRERSRVHVRRLDGAADAEAVFTHLLHGRFGAVWLDSAGRQGASPSRFSILGAADGPLGRILTWRPGEGARVHFQNRSPSEAGDDLVKALRAPLQEHAAARDDVPLPFLGGWVGWLGDGCRGPWLGIPGRADPDAPDAALAFLDRLVVLDHDEDATWLVALSRPGEGALARSWFATMTSALASLPPAPPPRPVPAGPLLPTVPRDRYLAAIRAAQDAIVEGETYEVCLTQPLVTGPLARPLDTYRHLRRLNPAPYAAFLDIMGTRVLSCSPEQFLAVRRDGRISARPIKGTAPRHPYPERDARAAAALADSVKDRAENLMITDLLRHDLGRVSQPGTVRVPDLMAVEAFATVHHLVSTITARLRPEADALDAVAAAFPPGSMTGAPKERTVEILDALEPAARGIYGGAIGWLGVDGAAELSVVIRTAVCTDRRTTVGVGGAITHLSDPAAEWEEARLKGRALGAGLAAEPAPRDEPGAHAPGRAKRSP
jgi:para-aminobenzoate synthetase